MSYKKVASVYDYLMKDVDYDTWFAHYMRLLELSDSFERVLEIGCGTGNFTSRLIEHCDVHAIDFSAEMLEIAKQKLASSIHLHAISFECADMSSFTAEQNGAFRPYDAAVAVFDVLNCVTSAEQLEKTCRHIASKLRAGGQFIFDVNSEAAFKLHLFDDEYEDIVSGYSHVWRGTYDAETQLEHIEMKYYKNGKFWFSEKQIQRAHSEMEIRMALTHAGFERITIYDANSMQPIHARSDRWLVRASRS